MSITNATPTVRTTIGSYSIRPSDNGKRFRITVPADAMRECNLAGGDRLAVRPFIDTDGSVAFQYVPADFAPDDAMTVAVNEYNSGVTRIPSATGQAFGFTSDHDIDWRILDASPSDDSLVDTFAPLEAATEDIDDDTTIPILEGSTSLVVEEVTPTAGLPMAREPIERKAQENVEHDGKSWSQEQFRYYLSQDEMDTLDWASGEEVAVSLKRRENRPALVFTPVADADNTNLTKTATSTGTAGDGMLYISNDIVRTLGFVDQPLMWVTDDTRLVATKTGRNR